MEISERIFTSRDRALQLGDHDSYRKQLSRHLAAARKRAGLSTPKNAKYSKRDAVSAAEIGKSPELIQLYILPAERAWSHAMSMKVTHAENNAGKALSGSTRAHVASRLNKASKYAKQLEDLTSDSASGATQEDWLQAKAYYHSLAGAEEFEKHATATRTDDVDVQREKLEKCLRHLATARVIYTALLKTASKRDVYKETVASTIDPSLRVAAYQAHIPRTVAVITIAKRFFPKSDKKLVQAIEQHDKLALSDEASSESSDIPNSINWRNRKANIVDASIGLALAAVSTAQSKLETLFDGHKPETPAQERAVAYDDVLTSSQDAADATRHALEDHEKEGISESDPRMQDLRVTNLAVNYDLIGWRVGRNRVLIGENDGLELSVVPTKSAKHGKHETRDTKERGIGNGRKLARLRERVVLYDAILQSIDSVMELPGAAEASFRNELEGKRSYFQALKCLNIAYSHALVSRTKNCLALLIRAQGLIDKAASTQYAPTHNPTKVPKLDLSSSSLQTSQRKITNLLRHYQGLVELNTIEENEIATSQKNKVAAPPIIERLNEYPIGGVDLNNLVTYPPQLKPIPVQPLFFDLAWKYIDYQGRAPETTKVAPRADSVPETEAPKEQKKAGWGGWFGRS